MGFRENLKQELEYQDLKVKELAEKTGISKRTLDQYLMKNPNEPLVSNGVKIANALGVSVEYLVTGEKNEKSAIHSLTTDIKFVEEKLPELSVEGRK